ncbi:hypothetical protein C5S35_18340 [Candidatus Methanophagaceae archaeon]|nr:hypothetical protein C5S35_18340 [Methanophagales archaeon]
MNKTVFGIVRGIIVGLNNYILHIDTNSPLRNLRYAWAVIAQGTKRVIPQTKREHKYGRYKIQVQ